MKKIIILINTICFVLIFGSNLIFASDGTEIKTWTDQILEYVPTIIAGIIAFLSSYLGNFISRKRITTSLIELTSATVNYNEEVKNLKELFHNIKNLKERIDDFSDKLNVSLNNTETLKKALIIMVNNNSTMISNGSANEVKQLLESEV